MDFKRSPLLLLCIGLVLGMAIAEIVYCTLTPVVLADGSLEVLVDRDYLPEVSGLMSRAQESIHVAMFSANYQTAPEYRDGSANRLLQQLVAARNRGVEVSVVMDDWPEGNEKSKNYLERNNVPVRTLSFDGSLHAKLIVIDGEVVIVGSTNWSHHSLDKNHEANVIIKDPRIAERFQAYYGFLST